MNKTLFKYIYTLQAKTTIFVSFFIFLLIFVFDLAEVMRKFAMLSFKDFIFIIKVTLLRTPTVFFEILHYIYFVTATFSLWRLCQTNQVIIMKSIGTSPQQILYPFLAFAFSISLFWIFVGHPIGEECQNQYNKIINNSKTSGVPNNSSIWIDNKKDDYIIFIDKIYDNSAKNIYIFNHAKSEYIFANSMNIKENMWDMNDTLILTEDKNTKMTKHQKFNWKNNISLELLSILSKPPQNHNIYSLYKIYNIKKNSNVNLRNYELQIHKLLVNCITFILFALIAAIICFPINRYQSKSIISAKVIGYAILLRFINNILESIGDSGAIPPGITTWSFVLILIFISISLLIWREV